MTLHLPEQPKKPKNTKPKRHVPKSEAIKQLENEYHIYKSRANTMNPAYIPMTRFSDDSANEITNAILCYIKMIGGWATRISVEGRYIESLGRRVTSSVTKGTADIHSCIKGVHVSIEVKFGRDKQSEEQLRTEHEIVQAEGLYFIARDFASAYLFINRIVEGSKMFSEFYEWLKELRGGSA